MDKNKFINKIPSYIYKYKEFNKFLSLVNDYILSACEDINNFIESCYKYFFNFNSLDEVDTFALENIVNLLGIRIPEVNKQDEKYKSYLDLVVKSVVINRKFDGSRESLKSILENIFIGSKVNIIDGGLNNTLGKMHLNVNVDNIVLNNIPFNIFRDYITPKILGVTSNFIYKQGDVFSYDLDFNEAVEIYNTYKNNQSGFERWLNQNPSLKFILQKQKVNNIAKGEWKEAWRGSLAILPDPLWTLGTIGITKGLYDRINVDLNDKTLQTNGYWQLVDITDEHNANIVDTQFFYADKNNFIKKSNLPYYPSRSLIDAHLFVPEISNLRIQQPANVGTFEYKGNILTEYFVITALYYYDENIVILPEDYIKACREIVNETGEPEDINMWINPESEQYSGGVSVIKTVYGFSNNEQLEEYKEDNPINNSVYVVEV